MVHKCSTNISIFYRYVRSTPVRQLSGTGQLGTLQLSSARMPALGLRAGMKLT